MNDFIKIRLAHPFAHIAKGWGIALCATIFFIAGMFQIAAHGQAPIASSALRLHVTDSQGAVIAKTLLFIHANATYDNQSPLFKDLPDDQTARTNDVGDLTLSLKPAFYNVCAFSPGFEATCSTLLIEPAKITSLTLTMKFDAFLCKYFCDEVPASTAKSRTSK